MSKLSLKYFHSQYIPKQVRRVEDTVKRDRRIPACSRQTTFGVIRDDKVVILSLTQDLKIPNSSLLINTPAVKNMPDSRDFLIPRD